MKSNSLTTTRTLLKLLCLALFIFLLVIILASKNEVRTPIFPYKTYEEEYIAAIDNYIKTGEVIIPEGTVFSTDGNIIQIKSTKADAWVTCRFVLDNTIPVYDSHYDPYNDTTTLIRISGCGIISFIFYSIINFCITKIYTVHQSNKRAKSLNNHKKTAKYGDNRSKPNCKKCDMIKICKCMHCTYLGNCGSCPTSDCEYSFEEILQEAKKKECNNHLEAENTEET